MSRKAILILIGCLLTGVFCKAQITPVVTVSKEKVLIGEPFKLTFELKAIDRNETVQWKFPDTIPHFEYVSYDTSDLLKREITISSFDSGLWSIDNIAVIVPSNVNNQPQLLKFPAKDIMVEYDTTGSRVMNDVKPIIEVDSTQKWIGYFVAAAALLSLVTLIILFRRWKKKKMALTEEDSDTNPLEDFQKTIQKLKKQSWTEQNDQKQNFSELSFAVKKYFERSLRQPFTKLTTDELIIDLKLHLSNEKLVTLAQSLRLSDAVKFAKFAAPETDCLQALQETETIIQQSAKELQPDA